LKRTTLVAGLFLPITLAAWHILPQPRMLTLPLEIAPRSFVLLTGNTVFFTEAIRTPAGFTPDSIYRVLYRTSRDGSGTSLFARLGDTHTPPLLEPGNGALWYGVRLQDSNRDGKIDRRDAEQIFRHPLSGDRRAATPAGRSFQLLAVDASGALAAENDRLFRLANTGGEPRLLAPLPAGLTRLTAGLDGAILAETAEKRFRLERTAFGENSEPFPIYRQDAYLISETVKDGRVFFRKSLGNRTLAEFPAEGLRFLRVVDEERDLLLDERFGRRVLFIGRPRDASRQEIFAFPAHATRTAFAANMLAAVFLTTWDSDSDNRLLPGGRDRSALNLVEFAALPAAPRAPPVRPRPRPRQPVRQRPRR
jgi:hypothetical protein